MHLQFVLLTLYAYKSPICKSQAKIRKANKLLAFEAGGKAAKTNFVTYFQTRNWPLKSGWKSDLSLSFDGNGSSPGSGGRLTFEFDLFEVKPRSFQALMSVRIGWRFQSMEGRVASFVLWWRPLCLRKGPKTTKFWLYFQQNLTFFHLYFAINCNLKGSRNKKLGFGPSFSVILP